MYAVQSNRLSERLNEATADDRAVRRLAWMPYDPAVLAGCSLAPPVIVSAAFPPATIEDPGA